MRNKSWFEENVVVNLTKIRLYENLDDYVTVLDMSDEFVFKALHINGEVSNMIYALDWEIVSDILIITDSDQINIQNDYLKKEKDGVSFYRKKRAELASNLFSGNISSEDVFLVDSKIKKTKDCLMTGDWMTGRDYLELETTEGAFTQGFKDNLISEMNAYISENYQVN